MRRQLPIAHQLYSYLYPHPAPGDPPNFSAHLSRNLVPEVRIEVATFYGDLNSTEARYPGLNYYHLPHRMRLGRFEHHRRLFEAFDELSLTYNEIQEFCCWEGTRWARERYEKDEGVKVQDTTGNEIGPWVDRRELRAAEEEELQKRRHSITRKTHISVIVEEARNVASTAQASTTNTHIPQIDGANDADMDEAGESEWEEEEEEEDNEEGELDNPEMVRETSQEAAAAQQHVAELERRRQHATNQRILAAFHQGQNLPPEIEQYLKEQSEHGGMPVPNLDLRSLVAQHEATGYTRVQASRTSAAAAAIAERAAA